MHLPPLYPITDAASKLPLAAQVRRLGLAGYPLVQFQGKPLDVRDQWRELRRALEEAAEHGGWPAICVNDRSDLALLAAAEGLTPWGLHLGQGDLPAREARALPGLAGIHLGASTHNPAEWEAPDSACDHAGVGPFRATAGKPGHAPPVGLEGLRAGAAALGARGVAPVAIGGLTLADARACFEAGAESLAMMGEVARAGDPGQLLWQAQVERWRVRSPIAPGRGIVLVGGSGGGKSSLAGHLARILGLPHRDSDQRVEADAGLSIARIFMDRGEPGFRALEAMAVRASGFCTLWLAEVPERGWARVGRDPARPNATTREQFMSRWARRSVAWSEAPIVLPLGRSSRELAQALTHSLVLSTDC